MNILGTAGGANLAIGTSLAARVSVAPPGSSLVYGNGGTYYSQPYQAYLGMWSDGISNNTNMSYTTDIGYIPENFPNGTTFEWDIVADPRYGGVEGYLALSYGNYDNNAVHITPKQVKNIATMKLDVNWTLTGNNGSGLLSECWLSSTSHQTGGVASIDGVAEVAFFPHCSTDSQSFAAALPAVGTGSFVDANGITWRVVRAVSGVNNIPYYVATRVGYVDHQGVLDYKSLFIFLTTSGAITGNEWFNGVAFGVEPHGGGAAQLVINSFIPTYS